MDLHSLGSLFVEEHLFDQHGTGMNSLSGLKCMINKNTSFSFLLLPFLEYRDSMRTAMSLYLASQTYFKS